jgi:preprotein translocase subunit YajC
MKNQWILAQNGTEPSTSSIGSEPVGEDLQSQTIAPDPGNGEPVPTKPPTKGSPLQFLLPVVMVVLLVMMFRSPKKQQQKHRKMVETLEKNDRVRTIGGIIGTVMDIKGDEVVIKVDESTNTKIRVATSAIAKNVSKETE